MTILPKSVSNLSARPVAYDVDAIRADFPILRQKVHGKPLVYLDNGASAQKPRAVLDTIQRAYAEEYANVHRGLHYLSNLSTANFEKARETVRGFINARSDAEIIFTTTPPKPSTWWRAPMAARISGRATRSCFPSWSTIPTSYLGIS
jgi:cysteine desulfurase/selenocysteine lyase